MTSPRGARRAPRPARPRRSGRTRALVSLGAVAVLATGLSVKGTFAFWTDNATARTGDFSSGTLDITVNGQLSGQANNGGTTTVASIAAANLTPGESVAATFPVTNLNNTPNPTNVPLVYTLTGTGQGGLAVTGGLQYSVTFNVTATNTGTAAGGNRAGSCGGTAATDANTQALTASTTTFATNRPLAVGATDTVCVVARLNSAAGNGLQNQTGFAELLFAAKQVGAP